MKDLDFQKHAFCIVKRNTSLYPKRQGEGSLKLYPVNGSGFIIKAVCESKSAAEKYIEQWVEKEQEKNPTLFC